MAERGYNVFTRQQPGQGRCRVCQAVFVGPGERCPKCRDKLRQRRKRKPR
jgi:uncharacterized OB-fold protein